MESREYENETLYINTGSKFPLSLIYKFDYHKLNLILVNYGKIDCKHL